MQVRRRLGAWLASVGCVGLLACSTAGWAQSASVSRPVVQGLPSASSQRLSAALARIARDPRDFSALIDAGDAANSMGDPEAAAGFYKRADSIAPNNARIKAGLARALVLQGNPTEAIPLFAQAESSGAALDVTSDRGLAFDLVGDPVTAQRYYQSALARRDDDEVRRRLGVSMAIAGNAAGSDAMLMPLLRKQDKPAWRAHAFALAIAGKTKEAVDTVNAILPPTLAQSVTPYLRYMPRLTRSQQAAAVNLGKFPRASEIGRDDPAIAAYALTAPRLASADAALIPRGKQLGMGRTRAASAPDATAARPLTGSERRARDKAARLARAEAIQSARTAPPDPMPTIDRGDGDELPALATSTPMPMPGAVTAPARVVSAASAPTYERAPAPTATLEPSKSARPSLAVARPTGPAIVRTGSLTLPAVSPPSPELPAATMPVATDRASTADTVPAVAAPTRSSAPIEIARAAPNPIVRRPERTSADDRGFDLANLGTTPSTVSTALGAPMPSTPAAVPDQAAGGVSLEQAFADLGAPSRAPAPIAGAVDVRSIDPAKPPAQAEVAQLDLKRDVKPAVAGKPDPVGKKGAASRLAAADDNLDARVATDKKKVTGKDAKRADAKLGDEKLADAKPTIGGKSAKLTDAKALDAKKNDAKKADKKALPSHPSRIWVQVGVGRDKAAIGFDWRKFVKQDPALFKARQPYISDMGRTNRVLAGPFETQKAAADLLAKLKKADFAGAFIWTSPAGQVVDPLPVK